MKIDADELYPYFYISDSPVYDWEKYGEVTLTEEELQYCKKSEDNFREYQEFLESKRKFKQ